MSLDRPAGQRGIPKQNNCLSQISMGVTIQSIFLMGYALYDQAHLLPAHIREAAHCIMSCRTAALGGHVQACPDGHFQRVWYNSCKHRMCPLCAFTQVQRWLLQQKSRLLNTPHFHVVFTISDELHDLWRLNVRLMGNILFKSATETLTELLGDPKYLGAKVGIIASLHTWTRKLALHPHLHCLVTAGGLSRGQWVASSKKFLLPFGIVRAVFRGKYLYYLKTALSRRELLLPEGMGPQQALNLINKLGRRKKWNVKLKETYSYGEGVLTYLARYLRGGPISNKRIDRIEDGKVFFNHGRKKRRLTSLPIQTFIGLYLQHVPPPHTIMVRSYGLYHHSAKDELMTCRETLGQPPVQIPEFQDWQTLWQDRSDEHPDRCPVCGKQLITLEKLPPVAQSEMPLTQNEDSGEIYDLAA